MDKPGLEANFQRLRSLIVEARGHQGQDVEEGIRGFMAHLSRQVVRSYAPAIRDELSPDAILSLLVEKVDRFSPDRGLFVPWCHTVVKNHAEDLRRAWRRDGLGRVQGGSHGKINDLEDSKAARAPAELRLLKATLEERPEPFNAMRRMLDKVAWEPEGTRRVDYYAVFLLHIRLTLAVRLQRHAKEGGDLPIPRRSEFIAFCLPWRRWEDRRSFRPGEPPLAEIWAGLASRIDGSETDPGFDLVEVLLGTMEALGSDRMTIDVWHQWTKRARDQVRSRSEPEAWYRAFGSWFPGRDNMAPKGTAEVFR